MKHYDTVQGSFELALMTDGRWCLTIDDLEASGKPDDNAPLAKFESRCGLPAEALMANAGEAIMKALVEADDAHEETLAEAALCGTCQGSGGGPDPETACRECGGRGSRRVRADVAHSRAAMGDTT